MLSIAGSVKLPVPSVNKSGSVKTIIHKDILDNMDFKPLIKDTTRLMDEWIFRHEPMKLIDNF